MFTDTFDLKIIYFRCVLEIGELSVQSLESASLGYKSLSCFVRVLSAFCGSRGQRLFAALALALARRHDMKLSAPEENSPSFTPPNPYPTPPFRTRKLLRSDPSGPVSRECVFEF